MASIWDGYGDGFGKFLISAFYLDIFRRFGRTHTSYVLAAQGVLAVSPDEVNAFNDLPFEMLRPTFRYHGVPPYRDC